MAAKEWKWGYIDRDGEFVITPEFHGAGDFHEGLAAVKIDWARGYIDKEGKMVITPRFEKAGDFYGGVAKVVMDGEEHYIDREGNFTDPPADGLREYPASRPDEELLSLYFEAGPYSEHLARVQKTAGGKWGFINEEGKYAIKPRFRQAGDFHEGLARVLTQV